ncbi:hypothetical protein M413DRAFT_10123 [Hebeloma cylindrosporum]|uniref:BTB domain-containing protein n=1 Tax=Hebeloma cylindrosporum TaxID=76867 RepID=A0A0C2YNJ0_HEBCY|nr:hypothetical protein M413DRAFT_10123 [Hebeloma cylindrosporum h7]
MDPTPQPRSEIIDPPQERTGLSPLFNDATADITFKSSDNILFKIHSKHLQTASAVLSLGSVSMDLAETVPLSEKSDVLEVLFQFIHPPQEGGNYRQPCVTEMEPNLFFRVAEAAEKYAVFAAMNVCLTWMHQVVEKYPFRVLNHSGKHDYTKLADEAAEASVSVPSALANAGRYITHPGTLARWVRPLFFFFFANPNGE